MTIKKVTDQQVIDALKEHGSKNAAAKALGIARASVQDRVRSMTKRGWSPDHDMTHIVPDGFRLKGTSTLYGEDGKPKLQWVKSTIDQDRQEEIAKEIVRAMASEIKPRKKVALKESPNKDILSVYPIVDAHYGMLAWGKEVGSDWDLSIAKERTIKAFEYLVSTSPASEECLIANLGDYFHAENMAGLTEHSKNSLDMDSRFGKMIDVGVECMLAMIDAALEKHQTVHVVNLRGNHDETASIVMNACMVPMFKNNPRVIIDPSPSVFKYFRFGNNFLGMHHGHTTKMGELPMVMASDRSKDWGETEHRMWLTGHIHHRSKQVTERGGCPVESFRTMIPQDSYAHDHGYRSQSQAVALVFHRDMGEIARYYSNAAIIEAMS